MGEILKEIYRVKEIMGVVNEQQSTEPKIDGTQDVKPEKVSLKKLKRKLGSEKKEIRKDEKELSNKTKKTIIDTLAGIGGDGKDVFGFREVYNLQDSDKLHAILKMLENLMCVNAKIAKILIIAQHNEYDSTKLVSVAQFPKGGGHDGIINTINTNMSRIDDMFKFGGGGFKIDRRLKPIRKKLEQASEFIRMVEPSLDWGGVESTLGFEAESTEDILSNSKKMNTTLTNCANQI